jgi:biopolymer transport protein ExbD
MSSPYSHLTAAQPNLTPILDMVFQLITFFMLVINFKAASMDISLKLPVIGSARPVDTQGQEDVLVLNIDAEGNLIVYGKKVEIASYLASEAQASSLTARRKIPDFQFGDELPTMVVVRADRRTPFRLLNRVLSTCQREGFRRLSFRAMNRET